MFFYTQIPTQTLMVFSELLNTNEFQISVKSDDIWTNSRKFLKCMQKFNENYTTVHLNLIEGGTTLLSNTFDKSQ